MCSESDKNCCNSKTLLCLLGAHGCQTLLTASLGGLLASLSVQKVVPPAEAGGIVANELFVVRVVVVGSSPDGQEVSQAPGEVIARVGVDGLEETQNDPHVHGDQVEVASQRDPENRATNSSNSEQHDLYRGSVLSSQTEGSRIRVVQLVDVLVQWAVVQSAMEPVVPSILHNEEDGDLVGHLEQRREGHAIVHTKVSGDRVEEPDLRKFNGDVADKNEGGAIKLFFPRRDFLLLRPWPVRPLHASGPKMDCNLRSESCTC